MIDLKPSDIIYSSAGDPCEVLVMQGDSFEVLVRILTRVTFNGQIEDEFRHESRTYNFSDLGHKWFYTKQEWENYHIKITAKQFEKSRKENAPCAPKYTEEFFALRKKQFQDRPVSFAEERDCLEALVRGKDRWYLYPSSFPNSLAARVITDVPYFARLDLKTDYFDESFYEKIYIGSKDIVLDDVYQVVDWRSPIGALYYNKQKSNLHINKGSYLYDYNLLMRRRIQIKNYELIDYHNEYILGDLDGDNITDDFLVNLLKTRAQTTGMKEIIQSIQQEQNNIIRQKINTNLVVQGCAGSGKTMILLHRLSYLKYNLPHLNLEKVRVLTPSKHFDLEVTDLAEVLDISSISIMSIQEYYLELLARYDVVVKLKGNTIATEADVEEGILQHIYSMSFLEQLNDEYCILIQKEIRKIFPEALEDVAYALPHNLQTIPSTSSGKELLLFYKNKTVHLYYENRKVKELIDDLAQREQKRHKLCFDFFKTYDSHNVYAEVSDYFHTFAKSENITIQSNSEAISEQAIAQCGNLFKLLIGNIYKYKDYREVTSEIDSLNIEIDKRHTSLLNKAHEEIVNDLYDVELPTAKDIYKEIFPSIRKKLLESASREVANRFYKFDWYIMLNICLLYAGPLSQNDTLINIDEGQDLAEQEFSLLYKIHNKRMIMNIYGDTNQLIHKHGITDWSKINFMNFKQYSINDNYRNSIQITEFANKLFKLNMRAIGFAEKAVTIANKYDFPNRFSEFIKEEFASKALVIKDSSAFEKLCLINLLNREKCNLISENDSQKSKNLLNVFTVPMVKGLEFQSVFVISYDMNTNEKYISATRALLRLFYFE